MRSALAILGFVVACAGAPCAVAQTDDALLAQLGEPPRLDVVMLLVRDAKQADATSAQALAEVLAVQGGYASAIGLLDLARHRDAAVRFAALQGIGEVALRLSDGIEPIRAALLDANADVRSAAYLALARVGDAADVPTLLDGFASNDERTHAAADRALAALAAIDFQNEDANCWADWWKQTRLVTPGRLDAALRRIDLDGGAADLRDARRFLAQYAWFDLAAVRERTRGWLRSFDERHRREGYRAAAQCRLGDLADDVRRAAHDELDPDLRFVALCSARVLGVEIEGENLPATVPDAVALLAREDDGTVADADPDDGTRELSRSRLEIEEARLVAAAKGNAVGSGGGGVGGSAVWLDLEAKRASARGGATTAAAIASAALPRAPTGSNAWAGYAILAVTIVLALWMALLGRKRDAMMASRAAVIAARPDDEDGQDEQRPASPLTRELQRLGLDPDALAAAAVRPREVAAVVDGVRRRMGAAATLRQDLWTKWLVARARRDFLENLVTTGAASHDDHSSWEKSVAECATVEAELAAKRETLFEAGTESLSTDSTATLARIRAQRSRDTLPVHLLVVERSDADWNRLEEAYRRAAEAKRAGEELDPDLESFIEEVNFDYPVLQARRNRRELLDAVTEAWEHAVRSCLAMAEVEAVGAPASGVQATVATPLSSPVETMVATPVATPVASPVSSPD